MQLPIFYTFHRYFALLVALLIAMTQVLWAGFYLAAHALNEVVPLKKLGVTDVIYLPTIRAARSVEFTRPLGWNIGGAYVSLSFQHAHQLDPSRSRLFVSVNGRRIHAVQLGPNNAAGTTVKIPIPTALLKDTNTLFFDVEQHYKAKCEDPTDPSLWTQILPQTHLGFDYSPKSVGLNFNSFPFPFVDPLGYQPAKVHYLAAFNAATPEILAMAMVNTAMGRMSQTRELKTTFSFDWQTIGQGGGTNAHLVLVGTPKTLGDVKRFQVAPFKVDSNNRWVDQRTGQILDAGQGLLMLVNHPQSPSRAVLIVTGNGPEGVLKAAQYLTTYPKEKGLESYRVLVPESWQPNSTASATHRLIGNQTKTFEQLGFDTQSVEKIYAPPITYNIPIVADYQQLGSRLMLDLDYSYGPGANPLFSSLELRLNDRSFASIPLTDMENGGSNLHTSIQLPRDLLNIQNRLVAKFHLLPDKYGYCKNNYIDRNWGQILKTSTIRVEGGPGLAIPDVGLISAGKGFPYTQQNNLSDTHWILSADEGKQSKGELLALLAVSGRLGRFLNPQIDANAAPAAFMMSMSQGSNPNIPSNKDVMYIARGQLPESMRRIFRLDWLNPWENPLLRGFMESNHARQTLADGGYPLGVYAEQQINPGSGQKVITLLSAKTDETMVNLANLFITDELFETLAERSNVQQFSSLSLTTTQAVDPKARENSVAASANWLDAFWNWLDSLNLFRLPWWLFFPLLGIIGFMILAAGITILSVLFGLLRGLFGLFGGNRKPPIN